VGSQPRGETPDVREERDTIARKAAEYDRLMTKNKAAEYDRLMAQPPSRLPYGVAAPDAPARVHTEGGSTPAPQAIRPDVDPEIAAIDAAGERRDAFGRIRRVGIHI
jgi:hypothetical protein